MESCGSRYAYLVDDGQHVVGAAAFELTSITESGGMLRRWSRVRRVLHWRVRFYMTNAPWDEGFDEIGSLGDVSDLKEFRYQGHLYNIRWISCDETAGIAEDLAGEY